MDSKKIVGIHTGPDTHLDHLGVLCAILHIPLIVTEENTLQLAKKFYPDCQTIFIPHSDLSIGFLAENFDVIFECGKFWALELVPLLELLHQKNMRIVFCPHGNSDKGHSLSFPIEQDISLVYGDHMIDLLKKTGSFSQKMLRTGNYRFLYYTLNKSFYDERAQEEIFSRLNEQQKTVLYAPTWDEKENPTSFFDACEDVILQLASDFNLIIKLHPFLEEHYPAQTYRILAQYEGHQNVLFLNAFPPIYPLLDKTDIYIGDFSSIGYDFLVFDRPMYFFNPLPKEIRSGQGSFLHRCGIEIPTCEQKTIRSFIESTMEQNVSSLSSIRKQIYNYAFGEEIPFENLRNDLLSIESSL
ncbi:MAG TPA: CDP-glycerol glycerophosphotransferase family protein [Rhabdochlamydiaceae bacterium]|nr:CDP-glycerol glycerophosphotransferase family protein [Rhabdochlamydiaceae bacterium]